MIQMYGFNTLHHILLQHVLQCYISRLVSENIDRILLHRQLRYTPKLPYPGYIYRILLSFTESADFAFAGNIGPPNRKVDDQPPPLSS